MLKQHIKTFEFWMDLILLAGLWLGVLYLPLEGYFFWNLAIADLLKIVALIASLETLGYFSHQLLGHKKGMLIQGFLGGLISSTMTFLRITRLKNGMFAPDLIIKTLILATLAMLLECILIIFAVHPSPLVVSLPVLTQAVVIAAAIPFLSRQQPPGAHAVINEVKIDEPIIWKKVLYFSALILLIIQTLNFTNDKLDVPYAVSSLLISLMEAHGVLAAAVTKFSSPVQLGEVKQVVVTVLVGSAVGKTYFVLRSDIKGLKLPFLATLYGSLLCALLVELML